MRILGSYIVVAVVDRNHLTETVRAWLELVDRAGVVMAAAAVEIVQVAVNPVDQTVLKTAAVCFQSVVDSVEVEIVRDLMSLAIRTEMAAAADTEDCSEKTVVPLNYMIGRYIVDFAAVILKFDGIQSSKTPDFE